MSRRTISSELTHKIILATSILVLGGVLGIIVFSGRTITQYSKRNADSSLNTFKANVEEMLGQVENISASVNWLINDHLPDVGYASVINDKIVEGSDLISGSTVAFVPGVVKNGAGAFFSFRDAESKVVRSTADYDGDYLSQDWFTETLAQDKGVWSEPYNSANGEGLVVSYSTPLKIQTGETYAVFSQEVSLQHLSSSLSKELFYKKSYSMILSKEGAVISHPDSTLLLQDIFLFAKNTKDRTLTDLALKMSVGESGVGEIRSERSAAIYGPLYNGWSVAIICPASEIFGGVLKFQLLLLLIALADLIVLYFVTRAIIGREILPITEITYLAKNVAKGNFKAVIPKIGGQNEIHHLSESLRFMLHSINDYISQLRTTTAENERFESELSIASEIQRQMLRTDFINKGDVDLYATLKPAKEVGGDMYDFLMGGGRTLYFTVGDVSGKGVPAALYMAISRSLFHYVSGMSLGSNEVVASINKTFCAGNDSNMFITLFVGKLDLDTGELVFCNAGHNPIIVIDPDGNAKYLSEKANLAVGVFDEFSYEKETITLKKGSRLLIYTDGVSEAENKDKDQYGEERLLQFAQSQSVDMSSEDFVNALVASVKDFTKDNPQNDDITVMSVKF